VTSLEQSTLAQRVSPLLQRHTHLEGDQHIHLDYRRDRHQESHHEMEDHQEDEVKSPTSLLSCQKLTRRQADSNHSGQAHKVHLQASPGGPQPEQLPSQILHNKHHTITRHKETDLEATRGAGEATTTTIHQGLLLEIMAGDGETIMARRVTELSRHIRIVVEEMETSTISRGLRRAQRGRAMDGEKGRCNCDCCLWQGGLKCRIKPKHQSQLEIVAGLDVSHLPGEDLFPAFMSLSVQTPALTRSHLRLFPIKGTVE
jgi:hypothetical protein